MPDPRKQDHTLGEGGLMFGKYITYIAQIAHNSQLFNLSMG